MNKTLIACVLLSVCIGHSLAAKALDPKLSKMNECKKKHSMHFVDSKIEANKISFTAKNDKVIESGSWNLVIRKGWLKFSFSGDMCGDSDIKLYGITVAHYHGLKCPFSAGQEMKSDLPLTFNSLIPTGLVTVSLDSEDQDKESLICQEWELTLK